MEQHNSLNSVDEAEGTATVQSIICVISVNLYVHIDWKITSWTPGPYLWHETKAVSACITWFMLFAEHRSRRSCRTLTALFSVQKQVAQNLSIMELQELFHFQIAFHLTHVLDYRQEAIRAAYSTLINVRTNLHANFPSRMMSWLCKSVFGPILPFSLFPLCNLIYFLLVFFFLLFVLNELHGV
jgi:hypothetical protein